METLLKWISFVFLLLVIFFVLASRISCRRPKPIPDNKKAFIGVWVAPTGFKIDIKSSGIANVYEFQLAPNHINDTLIFGVTYEYSKNMIVEFGGDSLLIIRQPTVSAREYHINKNPFHDGDTCKMILNGVLFIRQK